MKPLVAIVGRPNVGKSTLFNKLLGERVAIVEDLPGTTRDRLYGDTDWNGRTFTLVDTGGLELGTRDDITSRVGAQAQLAIEEADVIIFLVDSKAGITEADAEVADLLRRSNKPVVLGANKADNPTRRQEAVEFYSLGLGEPITLSSISGTGTGDLLDAVTDKLPAATDEEEELAELADVPKLAIVGRPNTGKSSLVNVILGEERVIVSEVAGTTRDTIDTMVEHKGLRYLLIDTAGIRRRGRIGAGVEKYSVLRADRAIDRCDVAVLMIDGVEGITAQDTHVAGFIHEAAKGIIVVINKWDLVRERLRAQRELAEAEELPVEPRRKPSVADQEQLDAKEYTHLVRERLKFVPYAPVVFASAKTGYHVGSILEQARRIYETRHIRIPTAQLNEVVRDAIQRHHPPAVQGRPLRIFYVTQAEVSPPTFVFFLNDPDLMHFSYERYLENALRQMFGFEGTVIRMQFRARASENAEGSERGVRKGAKGRGTHGTGRSRGKPGSKAGHGSRRRS
jgi:GTP-binding protein